MTTKGAQGIAAGYAATAGGGGPEIKIPEGLMKPNDMNDFKFPLQGAEQNQPMIKTSPGVAGGDEGGNSRFPYESGANVIAGPDPEAQIPEGFLSPVPDGRRDELPFAAVSAPISDADTSNVVTDGRVLDPGEFKSDDTGKVKIHPEPTTNPLKTGAKLTSPITDGVTAERLPVGVMKPSLP